MKTATVMYRFHRKFHPFGIMIVSVVSIVVPFAMASVKQLACSIHSMCLTSFSACSCLFRSSPGRRHGASPKWRPPGRPSRGPARPVGRNERPCLTDLEGRLRTGAPGVKTTNPPSMQNPINITFSMVEGFRAHACFKATFQLV